MQPNQPPPGYPVVFNQPALGALLGFDPYAKPFRFDGGAGAYLGISILAAILTFFTLGIAYPWAVLHAAPVEVPAHAGLRATRPIHGYWHRALRELDQVVPAVHHHDRHLQLLGCPSADPLDH
ncbi:hypothetical protein GCM10011575_30490 [Microlunatus endophyticus]|uniref:Uncharacterized protein n=1 Tax=Microlunatus endophyticus TaxID=1716077 RepID=A0A917SBB3_9ACTN|nr:hypothetical protein GCM10011575_30490 [Microlunatus endophyticus]